MEDIKITIPKEKFEIEKNKSMAEKQLRNYKNYVIGKEKYKRQQKHKNQVTDYLKELDNCNDADLEEFLDEKEFFMKD